MVLVSLLKIFLPQFFHFSVFKIFLHSLLLVLAAVNARSWCRSNLMKDVSEITWKSTVWIVECLQCVLYCSDLANELTLSRQRAQSTLSDMTKKHTLDICKQVSDTWVLESSSFMQRCRQLQLNVWSELYYCRSYWTLKRGGAANLGSWFPPSENGDIGVNSGSWFRSFGHKQDGKFTKKIVVKGCYRFSVFVALELQAYHLNTRTINDRVRTMRSKGLFNL